MLFLLLCSMINRLLFSLDMLFTAANMLCFVIAIEDSAIHFRLFLILGFFSSRTPLLVIL